MNSREAILGALRVARGERVKAEISVPRSADLFSDLREQDLLPLFRERLENLKGELVIASNLNDLASGLLSKLALPDKFRLIVQGSLMLKEFIRFFPTDLRSRLAIREEFQGSLHEFSNFDVGVTEFDCAIARTGSIALRNTSAAGRIVSVLPPVHVAIGRTSQLVSSLENWLKTISTPGTEPWSFGTVISGPSRTADIEKILVFGAHGPRRLIIGLLEE